MSSKNVSFFSENFENINEESKLNVENFPDISNEIIINIESDPIQQNRENPKYSPSIPRLINDNFDIEKIVIKEANVLETLMIPTCEVLETKFTDPFGETIKNIFSQQEPVANHITFIKYFIKALAIYLLCIICLKFFQNIVGKCCYTMKSCDCSDENIFVKIWTLLLIANCIGQQNLSFYFTMPELLLNFKIGYLIHIGTSTVVLLVLASIINGQTQLLVDLRNYGIILQILCFFGVIYKYLQKLNLFFDYLKTEGALLIIGFCFCIVFANLLPRLKRFFQSFDYQGGEIGYIIFMFIVINLYRYYITCLLPKIKVIKDNADIEQLNGKIFNLYLIIGMSWFAYIIGFIIAGKDVSWTFYLFLILYLISTIHMQTNIVDFLFAKCRFCLKKYVFNDNSVQFIVIKRCDSEKLFSGMKSIFTALILMKLLTIIIIKQWNDYYDYTTQGCVLHIVDSIVLNLNIIKIAIFLGLDIIIDVICFLYNRKINFIDVIYYIPKRNHILQGITLYFPSFIFEVILQNILYIS